MIEQKYCCGGQNALLKKRLGNVLIAGKPWVKGLFKCKCCFSATVRLEEVHGQRAKVEFLTKEQEAAILNEGV